MPSSLSVGGMRMSVTTTSGSSASTLAMSVGPSATVATTSIPGVSARSRVTASRTRNPSSATATRIAMRRHYGARDAPATPCPRPGARGAHRDHATDAGGLRCFPAMALAFTGSGVAECAIVLPGPAVRATCVRRWEMLESVKGNNPDTAPPLAATVAVLTVDDNVVFRRAAHDVIRATPGFEPVGEADTGEAALSLVPVLRPQLVLMDVRMPGIGGIEAARRIAEVAPERVAVVLMSADPRGLADEAIPPGTLGVVRKDRLSPAALRAL